MDASFLFVFSALDLSFSDDFVPSVDRSTPPTPQKICSDLVNIVGFLNGFKNCCFCRRLSASFLI